jgi:NADH:ubiquinone oxidoreductase subunit F (NADH-binding)
MRLLAGTHADGTPLSLVDHLAVHGPLPPSHEAVLQDIGLRGRGGAGFPLARKLAAGLAARGRRSVLVNVTESDPTSMKDHVLASRAPHLVIDGALVAMRAVAAPEALIATHAGSPLQALLSVALAERTDARGVRLLGVPARYLSGEASALVSAASGGPSLPFHHRLPLTSGGPQSRPTVVLNAESVAGLALLARHGAAWFRQLGTPDEPGTLLVTVRRTGRTPVVLEVPVGTPLTGALDLAGLELGDLQAVLVGGWSGQWLTEHDVQGPTLCHAGMHAAGGTLGAAVVLGLRHEECGLRSTADLLRRLAAEAGGQCGPCLNGMPALARAFDEVLVGFDVAGARDRVLRYGDLVAGRGLCGLPHGASALAGSALTAFEADLHAHARGGCGRPSSDALALRRRRHAAGSLA